MATVAAAQSLVGSQAGVDTLQGRVVDLRSLNLQRPNVIHAVDVGQDQVV